MHIRTLVMVAVAGLGLQAQAQTEQHNSADKRVAWLSETGAATLGEALVFGGLMAATKNTLFDTPNAGAGWIGLGAMCAAIPAVCAGGVGITGRLYGHNGRYWPAFWGAEIGMPVFLGLSYLAWEGPVPDAIRIPAFAVGLLAPPIGAVIGYNRSRPRDSFGSRLAPGSVGVGMTRDWDGARHPSLDVRLLSFKL